MRDLSIVELLVFRGAGSVEREPFICFGHIGILHPLNGKTYGFGPTAKLNAESYAPEFTVTDSVFSDHSRFFAKALSLGLRVVRIQTWCSDIEHLLHQFEKPVKMTFSLPDRQSGRIAKGMTNCVGAVRRAGVFLPGNSLRIREIVRHCAALRGNFV